MFIISNNIKQIIKSSEEKYDTTHTRKTVRWGDIDKKILLIISYVKWQLNIICKRIKSPNNITNKKKKKTVCATTRHAY